MPIIEAIVGFAVGILGNYVATATQPPIANPWQRRLDEQLADERALNKALNSRRSLRAQVRGVCGELSPDRVLLGNLGDMEGRNKLYTTSPLPPAAAVVQLGYAIWF
jgi:hypothetical protein